jgi:hypothetical protein
MAKKALLIGVNTYPAPASKLEAPVREAKKWASLLTRQHQFNQVRILPEKESTRKGVLDALRELLTGAKEDDLFFIGFACHGAHVNGWESDDKPSQTKEHGLIVYAETLGPKGFQHASITPSDIARILVKDTRPPAKTQIALGLDSCFAAAFKPFDVSDREINPKALFIPNAVPGLRDDERPRTFAEIRGLIGDASIAVPMIVAAAKADQTAVEIGPPLDRRLIFSQQAIRRMQKAFGSTVEISTETLVKDINPLRPQKQEAEIVGNTDSKGEPFCDGFSPHQPLQTVPSGATAEGSAALSSTSTTQPCADSASASSRVSLPQWWLEIRVLGLATFITRPDDDDANYRTRIVFPFDFYKPAPNDPEHHFGFVEVGNADMPLPPVGTIPYQYTRAGVSFSRWTLDGHTVRFSNIPPSGQPITRVPPFEEHVPKLTVVTPELKHCPIPRAECFDDFPTPNLFTGFIDLQGGEVRIGELETLETIFKGQSSSAETWKGLTPLYVRLIVPLEQPFTVITIENEAGERTVVYVRSGATMLVGNAREADITGPGSGDGPPEHFLICYSVSPKQPVYDPGLPNKDLVPINACTVTDYP